MKEFRTELIPDVSTSPINLKDKIFAIGSCFADAIGNHLQENKFAVWNNLFGTVYNPVSIHQLLFFSAEKTTPSSESYLENEEVHLNYHFHSSFSALKKKELKEKTQTSIENAHSFLKIAEQIIITYGTSFVYRLKKNNEVVANCHKVPFENFTKNILTESEIVRSFQEFYSKLKLINPTCKIILTVSPVRHLKDTLALNSVSKSILRLSCHSIVNQFNDVNYFPAYEIVLDDLRDYRFYETDRLHPTKEAIEYIWEKFVAAYLDKPTREFIDEWRLVKKALDHKPFHPQSESHQKFLGRTLKKLEGLNKTVDMTEEIQRVLSEIRNRTL